MRPVRWCCSIASAKLWAVISAHERPKRLHSPGCCALRLVCSTPAPASRPVFFFPKRRPATAVLAVSFVVAVAWWIWIQRRSALRRWQALGVGCLLGRRPGNWPRSLVAGGWVDFSRCWSDRSPVFNLAGLAINLAVLFLALDFWRASAVLALKNVEQGPASGATASEGLARRVPARAVQPPISSCNVPPLRRIRARDSQLRSAIDHPAVSSATALLEAVGQDWLIRDDSSTNGPLTASAGPFRQPCCFGDGDALRFWPPLTEPGLPELVYPSRSRPRLPRLAGERQPGAAAAAIRGSALLGLLLPACPVLRRLAPVRGPLALYAAEPPAQFP